MSKLCVMLLALCVVSTSAKFGVLSFLGDPIIPTQFPDFLQGIFKGFADIDITSVPGCDTEVNIVGA